MRNGTRFALVVLIVLCSVTVGHAIPQLINYQGILLDSSGDPVTTTTSERPMITTTTAISISVMPREAKRAARGPPEGCWIAGS